VSEEALRKIEAVPRADHALVYNLRDGRHAIVGDVNFFIAICTTIEFEGRERHHELGVLVPSSTSPFARPGIVICEFSTSVAADESGMGNVVGEDSRKEK